MDNKQFSDLLTNAAQNLIQQSAQYAHIYQNPVLIPLHTIRAGLDNAFIQSFLQVLKVPLDELMELTEAELAKLPTAQNVQLSIDESMQTFLQHCKKQAQEMHDEFISLEHIMLEWGSTSELPRSMRTFFKEVGFTAHNIRAYIMQLRKGKTVDNKNAEAQYQILEKYCIDITKQASLGKLDPVIGRHEEIRRVMQILSRRTKNNPILIGEPGVGKTAIVEGIAKRIIDNDVPESLKNKKIYSLDLGLLIAGAKYQGEFEDRLKGVLKEIESHSTEIILFIDELHMLVGTGATGGGGMDASNLLKPALARGTLHCIGATTLQEYKKYIEKDAALERRFQKVLVEEPSVDDAIAILRGLKERFELHHGIRIKDQALIDAVTLSSQYIADRFLPDKAIDLVDEAAAMVKMAIDSQPETLDKLDRMIRQLEIAKIALSKEKDDPAAKKKLEDLEKDLANLKEQHQVQWHQWKSEKEPLEKINKIKEEIEYANYQFNLAEREGNFAKASEIKYGIIARLEQQLGKEQEQLKKMKLPLIKQEVDEHDVAKIVSRWTHIPVEKLEESESEKLLHIQDYLKKRVIGQEEAITQIAQAIQLHRTGLTDPNKPIGSFLFLGPTGVGKTEVAKTLAYVLFNDEHKLIRIDMSEYMEKHAVARLIGAPPGYIGYEEGGQLTERVRREPYCVILFDEIEKAHPDVFNIFLQILDEGHLTDSQGRTVSFKNTIIIMTSNIGSDLILQSREVTNTIKTQINSMLQKIFRPEFLNRIDAIAIFTTLTPENMLAIAQLQINALKERLKSQDISLEVTPKVLEKVAQEGYIPEFGARPLKRIITQTIAVPISQYLLTHKDVKQVIVDVKNNIIAVSE